MLKNKLMSSVTNGIYALLGIYLVFIPGVYNILAGSALIFLGITSYLAHTRKTPFAWKLDNLGMFYALLGLILLQSHNLLVLLLVTAWGFFLTKYYQDLRDAVEINLGVIRLNGSYLLVFLLFLINLCLIFAQSSLCGWLTLGCFAVGFVLRQIGAKLGSEDDGIFHGLWHVFTGIGMTMIVAGSV